MTARLQRWIDAATTASPQRWAFGISAVVAAVGALLVTLIGSDDGFGWFAGLTVALAATAAIQAGSHTAVVVVALVVVQWMSATDDVTTPRSLVAAVCLLVFHSLLALMAVTPHSATVDAAVVRRWAQRAGAVALATAAVWALALVLERRDAPANPHLTLLALVAAGVGVVALLRGSVDDADR